MYYLKGQKKFDDCGKSVVATILGLYGIDYNYKTIGNINSFLDIIIVLKSYNIKCNALEIDKINTFPCIAQIKHLKHYHFVVIYEEKNDKFIYYSPNKFIVHSIKKQKFYKHFTNKCIFIDNKKPYCNYKICLNSLPFTAKIIIFNIFIIILILIILNNSY